MSFSESSSNHLREQTHSMSAIAQNRSTAQALYDGGLYQATVDFVDGCFGWAPGELGSSIPLKERAEWCLKQL